MKDVGLRIRVQRDLREQFLEACRAQDKPAAQMIREFMRDYVAENWLELVDPATGPDQCNKPESMPEGDGR